MLSAHLNKQPNKQQHLQSNMKLKTFSPLLYLGSVHCDRKTCIHCISEILVGDIF